MSDYKRQRLARVARNHARLTHLGIAPVIAAIREAAGRAAAAAAAKARHRHEAAAPPAVPERTGRPHPVAAAAAAPPAVLERKLCPRRAAARIVGIAGAAATDRDAAPPAVLEDQDVEVISLNCGQLVWVKHSNGEEYIVKLFCPTNPGRNGKAKMEGHWYQGRDLKTGRTMWKAKTPAKVFVRDILRNAELPVTLKDAARRHGPGHRERKQSGNLYVAARLPRQLPVQTQLLGCVLYHRSKPSKGTISRGCLKSEWGIWGIYVYRSFVFRQQ